MAVPSAPTFPSDWFAQTLAFTEVVVFGNDPAEGVTSFNLEWSRDGAVWDFSVSIPVDDPSSGIDYQDRDTVVGVHYTYRVQAVNADGAGPYAILGELVAVGPYGLAPFGDYRYCTATDMRDYWGDRMLEEWTNLVPKTTGINFVRLDEAIQQAQDEVDRRLNASPYALPLVSLSDADHRLLKDCTCRFALAWLIDHRPGKDVDAEGNPRNQARAIRKEVDRTLRNVVTGVYPLHASRRSTEPGITGVFTAARSQ